MGYNMYTVLYVYSTICIQYNMYKVLYVYSTVCIRYCMYKVLYVYSTICIQYYMYTVLYYTVQYVYSTIYLCTNSTKSVLQSGHQTKYRSLQIFSLNQMYFSKLNWFKNKIVTKEFIKMYNMH